MNPPELETLSDLDSFVRFSNKTEIPSLPLRGGVFYFDNSFLEALQECPRLLEYKSIRQRERSETRPGLNFGSAGHLVLDYRYKRWGVDVPPAGSPERRLMETTQARILADYFSKKPNPEDDWRNLNWAQEVFINQYNTKYATEPFNLLKAPDGSNLVEQPFAIPFAVYNTETGELLRCGWSVKTSLNEIVTELNGGPTGPWVLICFCGKTDLPFIKDSQLYIGDHKCVSILGDSTLDAYRVSPQQLGYSWAFWKLTGQVPNGFMVNFIRTRSLPVKAPKGGYAAWWEESFFRLYEYVQPHHFPEWEFNTFALLEEFFWHYRRGYFPLKRAWCSGKYGRCAFYEVCFSAPQNRLLRLAQESYADYKWFVLDPPEVDAAEVEAQVAKENPTP